MFCIDKKCYLEIQHFFSDTQNERCGILGVSENLRTISNFYPVETTESSDIICVPSVNDINRKINDWSESGICFCGIIHSHIGGCAVLSEQDRAYAEKLLSSYAHMPYLFFPVYNTDSENKNLNLYLCKKEKYKTVIKKEEFKIE